ncbi:hypothetical protein BSLG_005619 [Batrachochytrium salamandrivorans]|nr:hypothetical protein BSLG_005619 [Batrachochytrium salamandrivorans]
MASVAPIPTASSTGSINGIPKSLLGRSGLGKSTLVNTLFASHLVESKGLAPPRQTTEINSVQHQVILYFIEEKGICLSLPSLILLDTATMNNDNCWDPIIKHIKDQYALYLRRELNPQRERRISDSRIHAVIFFISPTGHSLTPLDITVMKKYPKWPTIPIIAKADSLTLEERLQFKRRIRDEIEFHGIRVYPFTDVDEEFASYDDDRADRQAAQLIKDMIPFAIVDLSAMLW